MEGRYMRRNRRGFTLAELLIVVAIIAVLVAISIPIFTSQLEKSRESVDLANARSLYAEVMAAAISEDTAAVHDGQTIHRADGTYSGTISPIAQKTAGWTENMDNVSIGGISPSDSEHWKGSPVPGGSCTVTYDPVTSSVTISWDGSSGSEGGTDDPGGTTPTQQDIEAAQTENQGIASNIGNVVSDLMKEMNTNKGQTVTFTINRNGTFTIGFNGNGKVTEADIRNAIAPYLNENGTISLNQNDSASGYTVRIHNNGGHKNEITVTPLNG